MDDGDGPPIAREPDPDSGSDDTVVEVENGPRSFLRPTPLGLGLRPRPLAEAQVEPSLQAELEGAEAQVEPSLQAELEEAEAQAQRRRDLRSSFDDPMLRFGPRSFRRFTLLANMLDPAFADSEIPQLGSMLQAARKAMMVILEAEAEARIKTEVDKKLEARAQAEPEEESNNAGSSAPGIEPDSWPQEYTGQRPVLSSNPEEPDDKPDYESLGLKPYEIKRLEELRRCREALTERMKYIHSLPEPESVSDTEGQSETEPHSGLDDPENGMTTTEWLDDLIRSTAGLAVLKNELGTASYTARYEDNFPKLKELKEFEKTLYTVTETAKAAIKLQRMCDVAGRRVCKRFRLKPDEFVNRTTLQFSQTLHEILVKALRQIMTAITETECIERYNSCQEILGKLETMIKMLSPIEPLDEDPDQEDEGGDFQEYPLASLVSHQLRVMPCQLKVTKATTKVRACRLRALSGLSLYYSRSGREPDWDLMARLWYDAMHTDPSQYCTTLLDVISKAKEALQRKDEAHTSAIWSSATGTTEVQNKKTSQESLEPSISASASRPDLFTRPEPDTGAKPKAKLEAFKGLMDRELKDDQPAESDRDFRKKVSLEYEITSEATKEACHQLAAEKAGKTVEIPAFEFMDKAPKSFKKMLPRLVHEALESYKRQAPKGEATFKCPHDAQQWSESWVDAQGALHPTFSAILFVGPPKFKRKNPIFLINEDTLFEWFDEIMHPETADGDELNPKVLLSPDTLKSCFRTVSLDGIHDLKVRSTGASSYLCSKHSHTTKSWQDPNLPIDITTCQLGQLSPAYRFRFTK